MNNRNSKYTNMSQARKQQQHKPKHEKHGEQHGKQQKHNTYFVNINMNKRKQPKEQ